MIKKCSTTLKATEARKNFFEILKNIDRPNRIYTITLDGVPKAVILSADEYESWLETMEIKSNPDLVREIKQAEKEFKKGTRKNLIAALKKGVIDLAN